MQWNVFDDVLLRVHVCIFLAEVSLVNVLFARPDNVLLMQPDDETDGEGAGILRADVLHLVVSVLEAVKLELPSLVPEHEFGFPQTFDLVEDWYPVNEAFMAAEMRQHLGDGIQL